MISFLIVVKYAQSENVPCYIKDFFQIQKAKRLLYEVNNMRQYKLFL